MALNKHISHLIKDKKLSTLIREPYHKLILHKNIPLRIVASIMSQQLNTKVAEIIYQRFLLLYNGKEPKASEILNTPFSSLRAIGLSNAKVNYVHNVARFCLENKVTDKKLLAMGNEEIIELLTQIKGVGQWTVEMLLMFTLGREDLFACDDLGLQQAMIKLYKLRVTDKRKLRQKLIKISNNWSPYKTYACLYLWQWKDKKN